MKSFKQAVCILVLLAGSAEAAGFEALLKQTEQSRQLSTEEQALLPVQLVEMYLWSKANFNLNKWPSRLSQLAWLQKELSQAPGGALERLRLPYLLLLQDYDALRIALKQLTVDQQTPDTQMVALLLGEEDPEQPSVWQINLQQAEVFAEHHSRLPLAQVILAEALLERQLPDQVNKAQIQQAQQAIEQALAGQADLHYAKYQQGQIYFFQQPDKAQKYFKQLAQLDGVAAEAVGNFYLWMQQPELAADFYELARRQDPVNLRIYQKLAPIYRQQAPEKLAEAYLRGWAAAPDMMGLYQGLQHVYSELSPQIISSLAQRYLRERSDLQALVRGDLAAIGQDIEQAKQAYREAVSLNPRQLMGYLQFMEQAWQTRDIEQMSLLLQQAEQLGLKHPDLQYWSAVVDLQRGRPEQAMLVLTELAPSYARARYTLAMAWHQQGQTLKAMRLLLRLLEEDPQNLPVLLTLGELMVSQSQWKEADRVYQLAQQLSPHDVRVYLGQAHLMSQQQAYQAAADLLNRASLMAPESLEIRNNLGNAYIRLNLFTQARQVFKHILVQAPNYAVAHYNLACIEALQDQKEPAYHYLGQALILDPSLKQVARQDPDLQLLRGDVRFQELVR